MCIQKQYIKNFKNAIDYTRYFLHNNCIVYKHTCVLTNKSYVGITTKTIQQRWEGHVNDAINKNSKTRFHKYIRKFNPIIYPQFWTHEILENFNLSLYVLAAEIEWVSKLQTNCFKFPEFGLNMTDGGDGISGLIHSPEAKLKIGFESKNRVRTEETKAKVRGEKNPFWGCKHTPENLIKCGASHKGKSIPLEQRLRQSDSLPKTPVTCYTKDGNFIANYESMRAARKVINHFCAIGASCRRQLRYAGGYVWRFTSENLTEKQVQFEAEEMKNSSKRERRIEQQDLNNNRITVFDSIKEASIITGFNYQHISKCCRGKMQQVNGFIFQYI